MDEIKAMLKNLLAKSGNVNVDDLAFLLPAIVEQLDKLTPAPPPPPAQ